VDITINYWAVLVCGVASMVLGGLWYGPIFGKLWVQEMGWANKSSEETQKMKDKAKTAYPQAFIGALLMAYVFAHMLVVYKSDTVSLALQGAFWVTLGFIVPVKYGDKLWGGKSFKLFFIDVLYYLVQLAVFALILTQWK
jgi:hypothetical protein